jgi:NHL repeat/WD40-like Beta Propeller Repeat
MQVGLTRALDALLAWRGRGMRTRRTASPLRRRVGRASLVALLVSIALLLLLAASSQAVLVHPYLTQITGEKTTNPFEYVCGINIDPASGELFTVDAGKVDVFDSSNAFLRKIKKQYEDEEDCSTASNSANNTLYVANPGLSEPEKRPDTEEVVFGYKLVGGKYQLEPSLTLNGSNTPAKTFEGPGAFKGELEGEQPIHVAVAPASGQANSEDVYVAVEEQGVVDQFNAAGEYITQISVASPQSITVGPSGELYVVSNGISVEEYSPAGALVSENDGASAGGFGEEPSLGLAVDASGDLYLSDNVKEAVYEFDSAGGFMGTLTGKETPDGRLAEPIGVAVNRQDGDVYVADHTSEGSSVIYAFEPAKVGAAPFLENEGVTDVKATSATLQAQIDPTGVATRYRFEYGPRGGPLTKTAETTLAASETIQHVSLELQGLLANTAYEYRVVVTPEGGQPVETGEAEQFTTTTEGAGLALPDDRAWELVTPPNKYGALIEAIAGGRGAPQASADGSGIVYSTTSPLVPDAQASAGSASSLSTRGSTEWSTYDITPPMYDEGDNDALNAQGLENRVFSSDLSLSIVEPYRPEPLLSSLASEQGLYVRDLDDPACQITEPTCYTPLTTATGELADVTSGVSFGVPMTAWNDSQVPTEGATPDLNHVVFSAPPLKNSPPSEKEKNEEVPRKHYPEVEEGGLYEWSATSPPAQRLQLVSLLPNGEQVPEEGGRPKLGLWTSSTGNKVVRHAISDDGSLVVWSAAVNSYRTLYLRDMATDQTIRLDTPRAGEETHFSAAFQTASADDSTIFFSDEQKLTEGSTAEYGKPNLYTCHLRIVAGELECPPEDLTVTKGSEDADLQGYVIEASEDGSDVYFVANGVLSSNRNEHGEEATPGRCGKEAPAGSTCNLYMDHYDDGSGWEEPRFIAALSAEDAPDWGSSKGLAEMTSRVSPDGRFLAFMSDRSLTGYDNTDASSSAGGSADEEVFLYDASTNRLICTSCDPSGARPHGLLDQKIAEQHPLVDRFGTWSEPARWLAGEIPGWTGLGSGLLAFHQSRYLSDEGRLFFNSSDALVPQDRNGLEDVYEYEPSGVGTCRTSPGCVALISSGESTEESAFIDASESGGDVFFMTTGKLVPEDIDESYDIYDAHDCAESPCLKPPAPSVPCTESASCQGGSTSSTGFASPASSSNPGVAPPPIPTIKRLGEKEAKPTRAQLLARSLKECRKRFKHSKRKRRACEKRARKKYGPKKPHKKQPKKKKHR